MLVFFQNDNLDVVLRIAGGGLHIWLAGGLPELAEKRIDQTWTGISIFVASTLHSQPAQSTRRETHLTETCRGSAISTSDNRIGCSEMTIGSAWARLRGSSQPSVVRSTAWKLFGFATWIPVIAMFNLHVAELTFVDGASMYPLMNDEKDSTLRRDVILNWKWSPQEKLERGMVVTLR
ncbi:hypothetical protein NM208_g9539 [Fusarium decemcellulare]|uniref:Uncharacterized protein n=1 Tax=Fusarium decemcellulare TaxID=57161 RepID=A0ACC1S1Q4_9HYPO|nr:hypothetical protein NM208_g9539 [Fusarium decemcellulare]